MPLVRSPDSWHPCHSATRRRLACVLDAKALDEDFRREHIDNPVKCFVGKKLRVRGTVHMRQEKPQILVNDWKQLELLDDK